MATGEEERVNTGDSDKDHRPRRPTRPRGPAARKTRVILLRWGGWFLGWHWDRFLGIGGMAVSKLNGKPEQALNDVTAKARLLAKRPTPPKVALDTALLGACHGTWGQETPLVTGYLCDATYDGGAPIGRVRLTFSRDLDRIRVKLQLENGAVMLQAVGSTPDRALVSLEGLLMAEDCPWEADPYPIGGGFKKKK